MRSFLAGLGKVARRGRAVVLVGVLLGLAAGVLESDLCRVKIVWLEGPRRDVLQKARHLLGDLGPMSVVLTPVGRLARAVEADPRVKKVTVARRLPDELILHVEPRRPAAVVTPRQRPDWYLLVDAEGMAFDIAEAPVPGLPYLHCLPVQCAGPGHPLDATAMSLYRQVLAGLRLGGASVRKVDFSDLTKVVAYLSDGTKAKIGLPDNLERKFALVGLIANQIRRQGMRAQYIDVRVVTQPVFLPQRAQGPSGRS